MFILVLFGQEMRYFIKNEKGMDEINFFSITKILNPFVSEVTAVMKLTLQEF